MSVLMLGTTALPSVTVTESCTDILVLSVRVPQGTIRMSSAYPDGSSGPSPQEATLVFVAPHAVQKLWRQVQQCGHREPDHVEIVPLDAGHERCAAPLDRIATRALAPFLAGQVPLNQLLAQWPEADGGDAGGV